MATFGRLDAECRRPARTWPAHLRTWSSLRLRPHSPPPCTPPGMRATCTHLEAHRRTWHPQSRIVRCQPWSRPTLRKKIQVAKVVFRFPSKTVAQKAVLQKPESEIEPPRYVRGEACVRHGSVEVTTRTSHATCLMDCRAKIFSATFRRTRGRLVGSIARIRPQLSSLRTRAERESFSRGTDSSVHIQSPAGRNRGRGRTGTAWARAEESRGRRGVTRQYQNQNQQERSAVVVVIPPLPWRGLL